MMKEWFENYYIVYALAILCGIGLLIKILTNFIYIRLLRASANMSSSKNKLVKQMKLKFETFYKLKIGVNNVDVFVDKYVYKYKICGLLLSTWENISGLMLVLCLLIAPVAAILGLIIDCGQKPILYTFFGGVCTSALLILVDNLFNIPSKRQVIKINIHDYLENYLKARLEQEAKDPEAFEQYRAEMASAAERSVNPRVAKKEAKRLEKEQKERNKFLELEAKQREREERKKEKVELKEAELARKREEKRFIEEERRIEIERKAEQKRLAVEEKKEKERMRLEEKQRKEEEADRLAEEKRAMKRQKNARHMEEKEQLNMVQKEEKEEKKHEVNRQISESLYKASSSHETAATVENKKKTTSKQEKLHERNERLKEEIQNQREQRAKDRQEGKDPFETFAGEKKIENPKSYKVNDFNMDYEMRVKAAQREEKKLREVKSQEKNVSVLTPSKNVFSAPTAVLDKVPAVQLRGNTPSEDKVIDDILKEFLA